MVSQSYEGREPVETFHLEVHPSVVFKLGEDLITDSMQALIELVKNCYDADATWAEIVINTGLAGAGNPANPSIVIRDNGSGMSVEQIRRGWLTISNSVKREMKAQGISTHLGRTPSEIRGLVVWARSVWAISYRSSLGRWTPQLSTNLRSTGARFRVDHRSMKST
ncbi:hypothetical protein EBF04_20870 [Streptomyces sp. I6]|nr:hypothetical protein EBF04_20870 [Streptomyces sp. I6]